MSLALLNERKKTFENMPTLEWSGYADPADALGAYAREAKKFVLELRSVDASDRAELNSSVDARIAAGDRTALIEMRIACVGFGTSSYAYSVRVRRAIDRLPSAIEGKAQTMGDPGSRRFLRAKGAEVRSSWQEMVSIEEHFIAYLQTEIQPKIDATLRDLAKLLARDPSAIRADINQRYKTITAYLAR